LAKKSSKTAAQLEENPPLHVDEAQLDPAPEATPVASKADSYKIKELMTAVVTKTGAKKKDAKEIVEAALAEIAAVLGRGQPLSLPPLGNLRVAKIQEKEGAVMLSLKLRLGQGGGTKQPLALENDDS
jgi:nucleoid DNA-binding protein